MSCSPAPVFRSPSAYALLACALVLACSAAARAQGPAAETDAPRPFTAFSASAHALRDSVVQRARAQIGRRYVRGGQSPDRGFDCSGLVRYVMSGVKFTMPRTANQQASLGESVARDTAHLRPGDLLTFGKSRHGISHVGIYVGNGRYIHASSGAGRVIESDLARTSSSLVRVWRGVRRIVLGGAADSTGHGDG